MGNDLIILKGRTSPETYLKHAEQHPWLHDKTRKMMEEFPVCPRCESIALRHHGWHLTKRSKCPNCGHEFDADTFLRGYLKEEMFK